MDELAAKMHEEISKHGSHVLHREDMELFWDSEVHSELDKRIMLDNFARHYGFTMYLSPHQMEAVFRTKD